MSVRIIGDVHGDLPKYIEIAKKSQYSVQVGDMGFSYAKLHRLDPLKHKFIGGNHDNYDIYYDSPHALGDYGVCNLQNQIEFFFIRGDFSIDKKYRQSYDLINCTKTWWEQEEISYNDLNNMISTYESIKPEIVISHSFPLSLAKQFDKDYSLRRFGFNPETFRTRTQCALQSCFEIHQPKFWYFGHMHVSKRFTVNGTIFSCLNILEYIDIG